MKGCIKEGPKYFCKKCKENVTRQKLDQLIRRMKNVGGYSGI
jgi:hypothetical protein